ncbi:PEP-CTERM sorting domain-containing protein [Cerasicoccus maritimus]|uniref:PEP-CTERM sorting domain-containing protein n=1 Tax=Cerasicoccus maritimus TaxID=490089 RepID=UPI002852865A|nr:PEP-CTERM sorting domain-containing protein [Cerasicoccus maritimus]
MKLLCYSLLGLSSLSATAAFITYQDGITNTSNASGPSWVSGSVMFLDIISNYAGAPDVSGATGFSSSGFDLFEPTGGNLDITLLTWEIGSMSLYQGAGTLTLSPGVATPGFEDYRYDDASGTAPYNLNFFYDGDLWASGYITSFVTEVDNNSDFSAVGAGSGYLAEATVAGADFLAEVGALTSSTNEFSFTADNFSPVVPADPGTFSSVGAINFVPEPGTTVAGMGVLALGAVLIRRRQR